jgi:hypothetical protein
MIVMLIMGFFLTIPCFVVLALFDFVEMGLTRANAERAILILAPALGYVLPNIWTRFTVGVQGINWTLDSLAGAGLILGIFWGLSSFMFEPANG